jgi:hypothetical protein
MSEIMTEMADDMTAAGCVEREVDMEFYKIYNAQEGGPYLQSGCRCISRCSCDCHDCAVASMVRHRSK